ncbi:MAG: prolipoprotein diacylglyceryl transferase family protein, partial [Candidatus Limnocylindria bacterium]
GMVVLLWVARRFARHLYDGDIALLYIMWYGAVRSALEPMRNGTGNWTILGIPTAIWIGIIAFVVAGVFLVLRHRFGWGTPGAWMNGSRQTDAQAAADTGATEPQPG